MVLEYWFSFAEESVGVVCLDRRLAQRWNLRRTGLPRLPPAPALEPNEEFAGGFDPTIRDFWFRPYLPGLETGARYRHLRFDFRSRCGLAPEHYPRRACPHDR